MWENSNDKSGGGSVEVKVEAIEVNDVLGHDVFNRASSVGSDEDEVDVACQENVREPSATAVARMQRRKTLTTRKPC